MKENWWEGQSRFGIRPGLDRISALVDRLGHPERDYPVIHVAGTNGKGSVAAMVTQGLMSQGLKVGLNISPDLGSINERVMIDRVPLADSLWDTLGEEIEEVGRDLDDVPTFFEAVTALALLAFSRLKVDVAVIEVGLGGRLDATNVVPSPLLSIITPIALDHMDRLGPTVSRIAGEKAGILKPGTELVLARQTYSEARQVVLKEAQRHKVPVFEPTTRAEMAPEGPKLVTDNGWVVSVPLLGAYQTGNLETAWTAIERLTVKGWIPHPEKAARAFNDVFWPGRFQVISERPLVVVDGAHNPHGIEGVVATLQQAPWKARRWHLLFGVLGDKPGEEMLARLLPFVQDVVLTRVPGERGADPKVLAQTIVEQQQPLVEDDLGRALKAAFNRATEPEDAVLVVGSLALLMHFNQQGLLHFYPRVHVDR